MFQTYFLEKYPIQSNAYTVSRSEYRNPKEQFIIRLTCNGKIDRINIVWRKPILFGENINLEVH